MRYLIALTLISIISSCKRDVPVVQSQYADSLIVNYMPGRMIEENNADMAFWKSRIDQHLPGIVNESKYAATLIQRFHQFGDIGDVKEAEKIMRKVNSVYNNKEASAFTALTRYAMLQHRFREADSLFTIAKKIGLREYDLMTTSFDVEFEIGKFQNAGFYVRKIKSDSDYGYFFRRSKLDHLNGNIDSAIFFMLKAAQLPEVPAYFKSVALSNAADLNIHAGNLEQAYGLYKRSLALNNADFHSMLGLGWIATIHDHNYPLAEKLFKFVHSKNCLPDPLFKLYQMAQGKGDRALERMYAEEFVRKATDPAYGAMYNKYLIELYTGILNQPAKADNISNEELSNRASPQTYAWRAWSLFKNNKLSEAQSVYKKHVSGKPLEALELYWMGKLMQGTGKGYNAREFFKAADITRYDLSPDMLKDLDKGLNE